MGSYKLNPASDFDSLRGVYTLEAPPANFFFHTKNPTAPIIKSTKITIKAMAQPGNPPSPSSLSGSMGTNLSGLT